jgi:putative Mg2+ transporter-C (MgtC) family protein
MINSNISFLIQILPMLFFSTVCGASIGFERGRRGASAGMKTQVFICVGSTIFTASAVSLGEHYGTADIGRMIAQIASGVGFIGAGAIMAKDRIIGLTTAAIIWVVASLGILCGLSYGPAALVLSIGMIIMIEVLSYLEERFVPIHHPITHLENAHPEKKTDELSHLSNVG